MKVQKVNSFNDSDECEELRSLKIAVNYNVTVEVTLKATSECSFLLPFIVNEGQNIYVQNTDAHTLCIIIYYKRIT
jgi:hypothetical protein